MRTVFSIALVSTFLLFACTNINTDPDLVTITGEVAAPAGETVAFEGNDTTFSTTLRKDGTFSITFSLDSSGYFNFKHGPELTAMYINPGDNIHLTIDPRRFDETIKYEGSKTSTFLAEKYLFYENTDFFGKKYYLGKQEEYESFLGDFRTSLLNKLEAFTDSSFIDSEKAALNDNLEYYLARYERTQGYLSQYDEDVRLYIMESGDLTADFNFYEAVESTESTEFNRMLDEYADSLHYLLGKVNDTEYIQKQKTIIAERIEDWRERKVLFDNMPKAGEQAVDFTYPDMDGNEVSLSSLQGKLVYVDIWATWCGPCLGEIPLLKELEKDYHDKDITFLSVSVDTDKEAWMKMVEEDQLGGVQLWADGWSQITKDYAVFGIPRFLLISEEGKVISNDAPRPSSPDIRELFDENL